MDSSNFNELVLKRKKEKVIRTVYLACEFCHLSIPTINFGGCTLEGANGPELGHYHPDGSKICISEKQLKKQNEDGLEETTIHEIIHHLGLHHGSASEKAEFERIKNYVRTRAWRPPQDVHFVSGKVVSDESKRIRDDPERFARVNEDSDLVKFLDGRPTSYHDNIKGNSSEVEEKRNVDIDSKYKKDNINKYDSETLTEVQKLNIEMRKKQNEHIKNRKQIIEKELNSEKTSKRKKSNKKVNKKSTVDLKSQYKPMTNEDIEKTRNKLGIEIKSEHTKQWDQDREKENESPKHIATPDNTDNQNQKGGKANIFGFLTKIFEDKGKKYCYECGKKYESSFDRHQCKYCKRYYCSYHIEPKERHNVKCGDKEKREQEDEAVRRFYREGRKAKSSRRHKRGAKADENDWNYYK